MYCNYSKDKFGNELTFIIPSWIDMPEGKFIDVSSIFVPTPISCFTRSLGIAEVMYLELLEQHCTPQQARQVLPNALKTELVMTGFVSDWQYFFELRAKGTTGAPHPDAKALAEPLMEEFYKRKLIQ